MHLVGNQTYKLKFPRKQRIYDVFHIFTLEQDKTKKEQVDKNNIIKLYANDNMSNKYQVETISNSGIYARKSKSGYFLKLYYLVF